MCFLLDIYRLQPNELHLQQVPSASIRAGGVQHSCKTAVIWRLLSYNADLRK